MIEGITEYARAELARISTVNDRDGIAVPDLGGSLLRPVVALAGWRSLSSLPPTEEFWFGALAVQLAHEASLVHDDVIDGATLRRGTPTIAAERGVAAALVRGDHLLTTAYRYAARTKSPAFVDIFASSVERTVAGELAQARARGRILDFSEYSRIARGKSGELMGCALAVAPSLTAPNIVHEYHEIGCRTGLAYQMLDDLLDLCPATDTGKAPLTDYPQHHWTWPLGVIGIEHFDHDVHSVMIEMHDSTNDLSGGERCLSRYEDVIDSVITDAHVLAGKTSVLDSLLTQWRETAADAIAREKARRLASHIAPSHSLKRRASVLSNEVSYLASNSKSFRLASRFFPRPMEARIARVYAWCRFTDDIVDDPALAHDEASAMLDQWMDLSRSAYAGKSSGIPMLDQVMLEMSDARVPFRYAEDLAEGMRMDLQGVRYASLPELRKYTYRVASVVGFWVSELFDVRDPAVLLRAESMGHAMQLTNILRDVGEDARNGRCYLPADLMKQYGVSEDHLRGGRTSPGYRDLVKELMDDAEYAFVDGSEGLKDLPSQLRLPVSVAARVYRGILDEIRRNHYDNLTRRAGTSSVRKAALMGLALIDFGAAGLSRHRSGTAKQGHLSLLRAHR